MEEVLIRNSERMFELVRSPVGLVLRVVCGRIGLYEVAVRLTPDEEARFAAEGESFIRDLADSVVRDERAFADRIVE